LKLLHFLFIFPFSTCISLKTNLDGTSLAAPEHENRCEHIMIVRQRPEFRKNPALGTLPKQAMNREL
jgi:hypothetical protein